jgi:endonuclease/exonuclease/phosphatase family metal-dependent hydrolase
MRLLTYNIHKGVGGTDRRYRLDRIIDVIRAEQPDLVCLQEVDRNAKRTRHDDQPEILAERLQANAALFQLNHPNGHGGYGNLLLSRWPLVSEHQLSIRYKRRKNRGAQVVVVQTPQGPLRLVNWHLGLRELERHWQVTHLLHHAAFTQSGRLPTLVVGDYNDWRNTLGRLRFVPQGFDAVTDPAKTFRSFPAFLPTLSLDKVYRRGGVRVDSATTLRHQLARRASDHLPLVVDFRLEASCSVTPTTH